MGVIKKGDPDAGAIMLKLNRFGGGCTLWAQSRDEEGKIIWYEVASALPEPEIEQKIAKQVNWDNDLWVIEIEDPKGIFVIKDLPPL